MDQSTTINQVAGNKKAWFRLFTFRFFYPISWQGWLTVVLFILSYIGARLALQSMWLLDSGMLISLFVYAVIFFVFFWLVAVHTEPRKKDNLINRN